MQDKTLRQIFFGSHNKLKYQKGRGQVIEFPSAEEGDPYRSLRFKTDDGLILTLLKKIEVLEAKVSKLKPKK